MKDVVDEDGWLEPYFTNVGELPMVSHTWNDIGAITVDGFVAKIAAFGWRDGSKARRELLQLFHNSYHNNSATLGKALPFPTGIQVAREPHPGIWSIGSHHQKFVITEKGAWIGGLNLQKHYWDALAHLKADFRRDHSGEGGDPIPPRGDVIAWHDVGALVRGPVVRDALAVFALRWDDAVQAEGAYSPIVTKLHQSNLGAKGDALVAALQREHEAISIRHLTGTNLVGGAPDAGTSVERAAIAVTLLQGTAWAKMTELRKSKRITTP